METVEAYLKKAAHCQQLAESSKTESEKAAWLQLADSWIRLMRWKGYREATPKAFLLNDMDKANGQGDPSGSH
jgi:hypothetical protein